ncbi:MAG: glycosyltransferase [Bryobacteraceae bacterium]
MSIPTEEVAAPDSADSARIPRRQEASGGPLRVVFVIPGEPSGSSMIFARRQAESLREAGIQVVELFLASRTSPWRLLRELFRFRAALKTLQPDVVHAHFGTVTAAFAALAAPSTPLVITYRGSDLNSTPGPFASRVRACAGRLLSQLAALRASGIVCVSRRLAEQLWWRRNAVCVLPSGVDPEVFFPIPLAEARRQLGWHPGEHVVLFNAGHDARIKRLDLALAAAESASRWVPGLRLEVLRGSTPPERMPLLMNASDCLLMTSDAEGSPTVIQEALAVNLPIVSVDVGDTRERLDGVARTVIAPRDPDALGLALARILSERGRSEGRGRAGEFSSGYITEQLTKLYNRCLQRSTPR